MENVPQVHGAANKEHFDGWRNFLLDLGYNNKWQDLNAKDYGIPQNRDRTFMVSWLGDYYYDFPEPKKLKLRLRDMLEEKVAEKYYLSDDAIRRIANWNAQQDPLKNIEKEKIFSPTLTARGAGEEHSGMILVTDREISNTVRGGGRGSIDRHAWDFERGHGYKMDAIKKKDVYPTIRVSTSQQGNAGVVEPVICALRGRNPDRPTDRTAGLPTQQMIEIKDDGTSNTLTTVQKDNMLCEPIALDEQNERLRTDGTVGTLTTDGSSPKHNNRVLERNYRIRKLTPRECWRLMGFSDEDFDRAKSAVSDSQLYKQAGNSICVPVLEEIFRRML